MSTKCQQAVFEPNRKCYSTRHAFDTCYNIKSAMQKTKLSTLKPEKIARRMLIKTAITFNIFVMFQHHTTTNSWCSEKANNKNTNRARCAETYTFSYVEKSLNKQTTTGTRCRPTFSWNFGLDADIFYNRQRRISRWRT